MRKGLRARQLVDATLPGKAAEGALESPVPETDTGR